ncbi:MAG: hypothetical protein C4521_06315 [Actinobacteria bacterium]|nr:MAG: hypothetical protein C4521_06315 [Actinomycetota bacterium]
MDLEDLTRKPVFDLETERFVGYVVGVVLDPQRTELLAVLTRTRFARPKMAVPIGSIALMHKEGVMIEKRGFRWLALYPSLWRLARRQRKEGFLVAACRGEQIGSVVDYSVSAQGRVTHLIVQRGMIGKTRRIRRDKVRAIEDGTVLLADDALQTAKPKKKPLSAGGLVASAAVLLGRGAAQAAHRVKSGTRSGLLGKSSPWTIQGEDGRTIVSEGKPLTEEALAAESARGKMSELAAAVAAGSLGRAVAKRRKKAANEKT